jgi:hypothetical protein
MRSLSVLAAALALGVSGSGCKGTVRESPLGTWGLLGSRLVEFHKEHDAILAGLQGTFRAIRIEVDRADLQMHDIRVNFASGDSFSPEARHHFKEGSWSRVIDLPGARRVIKSVEFKYKTVGRREGRAKVSV